MGTAPGDEKEIEAQLREAVERTNHLDVPRLFRCDLCGSPLSEEREICGVAHEDLI
jgi:hypothetical protein